MCARRARFLVLLWLLFIGRLRIPCRDCLGWAGKVSGFRISLALGVTASAPGEMLPRLFSLWPLRASAGPLDSFRPSLQRPLPQGRAQNGQLMPALCAKVTARPSSAPTAEFLKESWTGPSASCRAPDFRRAAQGWSSRRMRSSHPHLPGLSACRRLSQEGKRPQNVAPPAVTPFLMGPVGTRLMS